MMSRVHWHGEKPRSIVALFVETGASLPRHASNKCASRAFVFRVRSSCDCEKSHPRPAHCNTSGVPARSPPGRTRAECARPHHRDDCFVIKKIQTFHLYDFMCVCICWSTCQYGSICVYVCDKYVHIYTYIYIQYMSCTFMSCTSIDLLTNLHTSESIYIPIHTQNTHWFTYVCHEKFIFLRDSMMKKITKNSRELAVWRVSTSQKKNFSEPLNLLLSPGAQEQI